MKGLEWVAALVTTAALFLSWVQSSQTNSSIEDAHTGILTGTVYDRCGDLVLACREVKP